MERVNFLAIEKKWQTKKNFSETSNPKGEKFYCLEMFPYPSGKIHMGHVRNYTIGDVIARYKYLNGFNVLHPMGWDSFGLPAENASRLNKLSPSKWTKVNIETMRNQLKMLGLSINWDLEISTCDEDYYKHQQSLFIDFYKAGLISKKENYVNWDPEEKTVLANEQVINGKGWRSNAVVQRKKLSQWFFNISKFSDELLEDLKTLEGWPEKVKIMQQNWIGKSYGCELEFQISKKDKKIKIFTTRPDTIFGATFIAISPDHQLCNDFLNNNDFQLFKDQCSKTGTTEEALANAEKIGFNTGLLAEHPFIKNVHIPVYVANFVLMDYGNGAIFGCPAHDQRDFDFANKYKLPIIQVVSNSSAEKKNYPLKEAYIGRGKIINSSFLDGYTVDEAKNEIIDRIENLKIGKRKTLFRLKDWGISRQRYWGCPIPMIYLEDGSCVPVEKDELPVKLPEDINLQTPGNPLDTHPTWKLTKHKKTGKQATRETDTLDTFVDSSWYFLRFCSPASKNIPFETDKVNYWMPVDQYIGGIEHAILHLLYARFFHKLLRDAGLVTSDEPFKKLLCQGMVLADTYYREADNGGQDWIAPSDVDVERDEKGQVTAAVSKVDGKPVISAGMSKMSKSKNNGIDPQEVINLYGADTVRLFIMFTSPPEQTLEWSDSGVEGAHRFLKRVWKLTYDFTQAAEVSTTAPSIAGLTLTSAQKLLRRELHKTIAKVSDDIGRRNTFNTAIAAIMELMNHLGKASIASEEDRVVMHEAIRAVVLMLTPIVPHLSHHLWSMIGDGNPVENTTWPIVDDSALVEDEKLIIVQVNGKLRAKITVSADASKEVVEDIGFNDENVSKFIEGKTVRKVIYVPGKLLNIVAN
jgi:leucyl-tRNA synthetase